MSSTLPCDWPAMTMGTGADGHIFPRNLIHAVFWQLSYVNSDQPTGRLPALSSRMNGFDLIVHFGGHLGGIWRWGQRLVVSLPRSLDDWAISFNQTQRSFLNGAPWTGTWCSTHILTGHLYRRPLGDRWRFNSGTPIVSRHSARLPSPPTRVGSHRS